ncbi:XamI family restriction endonuclease [Curtobacterium sp. SORGH_AS_0776]|uniref:XamI family restriction endonuclease n=1 Tax=Curtobacterium sp. SORGH_AS_0776 TaxID=3041798 RepID=UPI0028624893|nr:hypothetical protein [Curtobacterium sp. SORGH_AS_0776]
MRRFLAAPQWSDGDLQRGRDRAEREFTSKRRAEGPDAFERTYWELRPRVDELLRGSDNLRALNGDVFRRDPDAWQPSRYLTGPPISQEDLWTLTGGTKFRRVPNRLADDTAEALNLVIDPVRFPWVSQNRDPQPSEREHAISATTLLWAAQHLGTVRRGSASKIQEKLTGETLNLAGLTFDAQRAPIELLDDIDRGSYSKERHVHGAKCDVPSRLFDGRMFLLECKVSNGPKNGWKRVNREVRGKADGWTTYFGAQSVTGVVLSGVFDLSALKAARDAGVVVFWEHDLNPLFDFAVSAK